MTHWARQYIGLPWAAGESGPSRFNCWGLVRYVYRTHFGIELPVVAIAEDGETCIDNVFNIKKAARAAGSRPLKDAVAKPQESDIVLMYGAGTIHCGLVVQMQRGIRVLHAVRGAGVIAEPWAQATAGLSTEIWRRTP